MLLLLLLLYYTPLYLHDFVSSIAGNFIFLMPGLKFSWRWLRSL